MAFARVRGPGQPDQVCDLVAASIVEEYIRRDSAACLNVRVCGGREAIFVSGEVASKADFDVSSIVKRTLGSLGIAEQVEPFISLDPMDPAWAKPVGSREAVSVFGYATNETSESVPRAAFFARSAARELERLRTGDADWFWLGSDYEIFVEDGGAKPVMIVRAQHGAGEDLGRVRERILAVLVPRFPEVEIVVNPSGEETAAGFARRVGGSGRAGSAELFGSNLPSNLSGVGYHPAHPLNAGAWLARLAAQELVRAGYGKAVWLTLAWLPLEARPSVIRARNERGEDLTRFLAAERFDLSHLPDALTVSQAVREALREGFDGTALAPWMQP